MDNAPVYAAPATNEARRSGDGRRGTLTIGDLAREFDLTLRTLRFYEDRGLLSPRRVGSSRLYDARDRERLALIVKGKQLGFTLAEVRALLQREDRGEGGVTKLQLSAKEIEDQIAHLEQQKADLETALAELNAQRQRLRSP